MNKTTFENLVEDWVYRFIDADENLTCCEIFTNTNISKISHSVLDQMSTSKLCDFNCDFVVLVQEKNKEYQLIFINRFTKSIGIKDIGEMLIYAKIAKPLYAFLISVNGHSSEINNTVTNNQISIPLFQYDLNKSLILFALNENGVQKDSILPLNSRDFFYRKIPMP
jgi:hypothetical protein